MIFPFKMRQAMRVIPACALMAGPLGAATLHVDPKGDDSKGTGSAELPWKTVQRALDECGPGDAVLMHPGVYAQRAEFHESGQPDKLLTLMAEPGAVFSGKGMPRGEHVVAVYGQSYIKISGLEIRDTLTKEGGCGIYVEGGGQGITIQNCWLHHLKGREAGAIGIFGTDAKVPLSNILIEGCRIEHCEPAQSEALVLNGNVDGFKVINNSISDVNNIGIDFIGGERDVMPDPAKVARNGECSGNRVTRARSTYGDGYAAGIYVDGGQDIRIRGNIVTECDLGIEVGAENPGQVARGITVEENILFKNDKAGLVFGGYDKKRGKVTGCLFQRNILWHNTNHKKPQAELWIQEAFENRVEGNTIVAGSKGMILQALEGGVKNTIAANRWFGPDAATVPWTWGGKSGKGFPAWQAASGQSEGSTWEDPQFPDPAKGDFGR